MNPVRSLWSAVATASLFAVPMFSAPVAAHGEGPTLGRSQAGYYRLKVGEVDVVALSDGTVRLSVLELLTHARDGEAEKLLADAYLGPEVDTSINAYLIVSGEKIVLVDTGGGDLFGPSLNKLPASLAASGYRPEQVTDVLITHLHTDHAGGLTAGDRKVFPNATVHVETREAAYWLSEANMKSAPESKQASFRTVMRKLAAYQASGRFRTFDGETKLFPGIRAIPTPGHTPGHSFYALESKGEQLLFWGDIMHVADVQFPNPSITIQFDVDSPAAAEQRIRAYADAARYGHLVAPAHVSFPGIGRLRVDGSGYRWIPVNYVNDAHAP